MKRYYDPLHTLLGLLRTIVLRILHAAAVTQRAAADLARLPLWRTDRRRPLRRADFARLPSHLGIVLAPRNVAHGVEEVATLVGWCAAAGVQRITLCDAHGALVRCAHDLRSALGAGVCVLRAGEEPPAGGSASAGRGPRASASPAVPLVRIVALQTGRDDLVHAARRLCDRVRSGSCDAASIDEAAIEAELVANAGFPEPELVLQCCPQLHLGGLLPWHCRVTQFAHMGPLHHVTAERVRVALDEYGRVQQRHGR